MVIMHPALSVQQAGDVFGEARFGVVSWLVPDNLPGVGYAPERPGVVRDAVEDVERDAVFVFYVRRLYGRRLAACRAR